MSDADTNPFVETAASQALSSILITNTLVVFAVFLAVQLFRKKIPAIWTPQNVLRPSATQPTRPKNKFSRFISRLWFMELHWTDAATYAARVGSTAGPFLRWQRFVILQLCVFLLGSVILIPINLLGDPKTVTAEGEYRRTIFVRVQSDSLKTGSPWLWCHLVIFALFCLYFVFCYAHFTRRHVALVQNLKIRRPTIAAQTVMVRNIPAALQHRGIFEQALATTVEPGSVARVCPAPPNAPVLSRLLLRLRKNEISLLNSRQALAQADPVTFVERHIAGIAAAEEAAAAAGDTRVAGWAAAGADFGDSAPKLYSPDGTCRPLALVHGVWVSAPAPAPAPGPAAPAPAPASEAEATDEDSFVSVSSDDGAFSPASLRRESALPTPLTATPAAETVPDFIAAAAATVADCAPAARASRYAALLRTNGELPDYTVFSKAEQRQISRALRRKARQQPAQGALPKGVTPSVSLAASEATAEDAMFNSMRADDRFRHSVRTIQQLRARIAQSKQKFFNTTAATSPVAFVVFNNRSSAAAVAQSLMYPDSTKPSLSPAPDPADIIWRHAGAKTEVRGLGRFMYFGVTVTALLLVYLLPVTVINAFFSTSSWADADAPVPNGKYYDIFLFMKKVVSVVPEPLLPFIAGYAPSLALSVLMGVLPKIAALLSRPMRPLTSSQSNYWSGWIIWIFLTYSIFLNTIVVNFGSEVLKWLSGDADNKIADLISLKNSPIARALTSNGQFFATYILQKHLLGPALAALRFNDLISVLRATLRARRARKITEKAARARARMLDVETPVDGEMVGAVDVANEEDTGASDAANAGRRVEEMVASLDPKPFDVANNIATDAFLLGLSVVYCIYAPLLAPLLLYIFYVKTSVDRYVLFHISPPIPDPEWNRDLYMLGMKWISAGFVTGGIFSGFWFAANGTMLMGQIALGVAGLTLLMCLTVYGRYERSLRSHALQLPPQFDDSESREIAQRAYWMQPPVRPGDDVRGRSDYEHPAFAACTTIIV